MYRDYNFIKASCWKISNFKFPPFHIQYLHKMRKINTYQISQKADKYYCFIKRLVDHRSKVVPKINNILIMYLFYSRNCKDFVKGF